MSAGNDLAEETAHLSLVDAQQTIPPHSESPAKVPNPPRITSRGIKAKDITSEFTAAASTLDTGQLIKDEFLTLYESVSALEIMDAKMDSGFLEPGDTLDDNYDVLRELLPEEVVGIMDQLLCHEMAWHKGHPLSQTLFTSIYIDRLLWPEPKTLDQSVFSREEGDTRGGPWVHIILRAYCLGLIKGCDFVHAGISGEQFYEEEDFVTHLYNRNLFSGFSAEKILLKLQEAVQFVEDADIDGKLMTALGARLRFRIGFLTGLSRGTDAIENKEIESWKTCLHVLPQISESHGLGKAVEESCSLKIQRRLASSVPPRPMVTIKFEEAIKFVTQMCKDATDVVQILDFHGSDNLMTLVRTFQSRRPQSCIYIRTLLQSLMFSGMKILGTMSLKQLLYDDLAEVCLAGSNLLDRSYEEIELPSDPRFQLAKLMDEFVQMIGSSYMDIYRTVCLNRSRIRRSLCHTIADWDSLQVDAEELDTNIRNLTNETPLMIPQLPTPSYSLPLSSWTYHHKLNLLQHVLQLGFELSVYAPDELAGMYWYLTHITQTHVLHLDRMKVFTVARKTSIVKPPNSKSSSSPSTTLTPSTTGSTIAAMAAIDRSLTHLQRSRLHLTATLALASALHAVHTLLTRHQLIPIPPRPYSTAALRYELRMKPFIPISLPELVPYDVFVQEVSCSGTSDSKLLDYASRSVTEARKAWEEVLKTCRPPPPPPPAPGGTAGEKKDNDNDHNNSEINDPLGKQWEHDIKDSVRACIGASLAVAALKKALAVGAGPGNGGDPARAIRGLTVELPEAGEKGNWHVWWIVPKISSS